MTLLINDKDTCPECGAYWQDNGFCSNGHAKPKPKIYINPPPSDRRCECCCRHVDELEEFGGDTEFSKAKLVKNFRTMAPLEALEGNPISEGARKIYEDKSLSSEEKERRFAELEKKLTEEHGEEKMKDWWFQEQVCNTVEASWECKDCFQLWGEEFFKKRHDAWEERKKKMAHCDNCGALMETLHHVPVETKDGISNQAYCDRCYEGVYLYQKEEEKKDVDAQRDNP